MVETISYTETFVFPDYPVKPNDALITKIAFAIKRIDERIRMDYKTWRYRSYVDMKKILITVGDDAKSIHVRMTLHKTTRE